MSFVKNLRGALERSFLSLPLILAGWSLFLGCTTGNVGLLVLAVGQIFIVPATTAVSNIGFEFLNSVLSPYIGDWKPSLTVQNRDICNLIPGATDYGVPNVWVAPSYWLAHVTFFFAFLISSATHILTMEAVPNADPEKVERRKSQATLSLMLAVFTFIVVVGVRKAYSNCDTFLGGFITLAIMAPIGYGWYELARKCSARDADIFGIVQKILPSSAQDQPPMTCVYTGSP
jgi:hypothetical protein